MLETELSYEIKDVLCRLFAETGTAVTFETTTATSQALYQPDMILSLKIDDRSYKMVVEVKSLGQPRFIRLAAQQLTEYMDTNPDVAYGILAAPYLSDEGRQLCKRYGIGYVDLAGNTRLAFEHLYIDIQGRRNPYPTTRGLKSLFRKKSTRAIRVLLADVKRFWYVQDLASESDLSLGQVSNIKRLLIEEDLLQEKGKSFRLTDPERLLDAWAQDYSFRYNDAFDFYSLEGTQAERKIASFCKENGITYALTLFSGANLVSPFVRYTRSFVYVQERIVEVARQLDLKEVTSGPNVTLLKPYDKGIFYGIQNVKGMSVVSDIQLYLDLKKYRGRGEEAALYVLDNRLRPTWH